MPSRWVTSPSRHVSRVSVYRHANSCASRGAARRRSITGTDPSAAGPAKKAPRGRIASITSAKKSSMFRAEKADQRGEILGNTLKRGRAQETTSAVRVEDNGTPSSAGGGWKFRRHGGGRAHLETSCGTLPDSTVANAIGTSHRKATTLQKRLPSPAATGPRPRAIHAHVHAPPIRSSLLR